MTLNGFDLSGKKALVTGASGGLGQAIATAFHKAGVALVISGRSARIEDVAQRLKITDAPVVPVRADMRRREDVRRLFETALDVLGELDIVVAAHGVNYRSPAETFPLEAWDEIIEVNLTSVFILSQLAGRHMLARGRGKIILIASMLSFSGGITVPAYAASKGGIAQLTKALANEWASRGVNVNAVAPGYFRTEMTRALYEDPVRYREILDRIPAGRWGVPEDLVGAVLFLASPAADYVHGAILPVDGGWMAR